MKPYRWRPLTGVSKEGLTDPDGYFWAEVPDVRRNADPEAVERELRAQVEAALAAGIDVTHLDCHMGTAMMVCEMASGGVRNAATTKMPMIT